jgi:hypothetical protein
MQVVGMEVLQDPGAASVVIKKIGNWKVHISNLRNCTLSVHEPACLADSREALSRPSQYRHAGCG